MIESATKLSSVIVALSEGDYQDLAQLGYLPEHPEHVMQRCLRYIFLQGGRVAYGGNLSGSGITFDVVQACVQAYSGRQLKSGQPPFIHVIAEYLWRQHLDSCDDNLFDHFCNLGSCGEIWLTFADDSGRKIVGHAHMNKMEHKVVLNDSTTGLQSEAKNCNELKGALPSATRDFKQPASIAASLTSMRLLMAQNCDMWISAGGKFSGYSGAKPGIAEEALYAIEAGKPVFPLGAFGGCARDIADALALLTDDGPTPGRSLGDDYLNTIDEIRNARDAWRALLSDDCNNAAKDLANADNPDHAETALNTVVQKCLTP